MSFERIQPMKKPLNEEKEVFSNLCVNNNISTIADYYENILENLRDGNKKDAKNSFHLMPQTYKEDFLMNSGLNIQTVLFLIY